MTHGEYAAMASYWDEKDAAATGQMERAQLLHEAEAFIRAHNTCALATGAGEDVRCTPIEYNYKDGCFWLFSEGGHKFAMLERNANVCLAIFDPYTGFGTVGGMQVTGTAELIERWSPRYLELLAYKNLSADALRRAPHPLHLLKIAPKRIDLLCAAFKSRGFDQRQHLEF